MHFGSVLKQVAESIRSRFWLEFTMRTNYIQPLEIATGFWLFENSLCVLPHSAQTENKSLHRAMSDARKKEPTITLHWTFARFLVCLSIWCGWNTWGSFYFFVLFDCVANRSSKIHSNISTKPLVIFVICVACHRVNVFFSFSHRGHLFVTYGD